MIIGKNASATQQLTLPPAGSVPMQDALHTLLEFARLLGTLRPPDGETGGSPTVILTAAGVEIRMSDALLPASAVPVEWFRKIEEGLESVRKATDALNRAFEENVRNAGQTLASHAAAIDSMRAALNQNEQVMESIVELLGSGDNLSSPETEAFANIR
jgi:hypothetical protein